MLKLKVYWVQLEFPDSCWSIEASLDAKSPSVLAELVARREQSVVRNELSLSKGDSGSVGCRAGGYGYGPYDWGDVASGQRVDGLCVRRPPHDKGRRPLSPNVALAVVGQKAKFCKGIIAFVLWRVRLGGVYQRRLRGRKGERGKLIWRGKKVSGVFVCLGTGKKMGVDWTSPSV